MRLQSVMPDFYDLQTKSPNPIRRWFHTARHQRIYRLVDKYYGGGTIVDIGCGNCNWNTDSVFPVIGIDGDSEALKHCLKTKRITRGIISLSNNTTLKDNTANIVVCAETLEHLKNYEVTIDEIKRILQDGGHAIISVPYDRLLSFWQPLFRLQCFYHGRIKGDSYYRNKCGHINHFSTDKLCSALSDAGLKVIEQKVMSLFTIFVVARKPEAR